MKERVIDYVEVYFYYFGQFVFTYEFNCEYSSGTCRS